MEDTYIKLYRKLLDNREMLKDHTALSVFIWLMLRADYKTGKVETGRFVAASELGLNPNTFYKALTRLRNRKMVTQESNNRFTVITISNWHKYQSAGNNSSNNKVTTEQQQSNTIQEVKKKRNKENNIYSEKDYLTTQECREYLYNKFPNIMESAIKRELDDMMDWIDNAGKKGEKSNYRSFASRWIRSGIDKLPKKIFNEVWKPPVEEVDEAGMKKLNELKKQYNIGGVK